MATPILPVRMPIPLRRAMELEAARSGRTLSQIIIEAVEGSGIKPIYRDDEISPPSIRIPPGFYLSVSEKMPVPTALASTKNHITIRLDDPNLPPFLDAARRCIADESHSLGLRKSARATINKIERADPGKAKA